MYFFKNTFKYYYDILFFWVKKRGPIESFISNKWYRLVRISKAAGLLYFEDNVQILFIYYI